MAAQKRSLDDSGSTQKHKKSKLTPNEIDFPRGGGTSFTPLEVKTIRAEALKEADQELFKAYTYISTGPSTETAKTDRIRIEHLNYKRITVGMKIFGQIIAIQPLALVVSLPNQLFGHVPITNISAPLTALLEKAEAEDDEEDDTSIDNSGVPDLFEIFHEGQYVRAIVTGVHAAGITDVTGIGRSRDESVRASKRIELSLDPQKVNADIKKSDIVQDFTLSAAIKSVEDHGYQLDVGIRDLATFLPFKDAKAPEDGSRLYVGQLVDVTVQKVTKNARTCNVTNDPMVFATSSLTEITILITATHTTGFNVQVLGFFEGTIDRLHLPRHMTEKSHKIGKKVKARVLYEFSTSPPKFALALNEHILELGPCKPKSETSSLQQLYPIGKILPEVKVLRIQSERGVDVEVEPGLEGFAHVIGSIHRARVTGYFPFDGVLQLSLKASVIDQQFFQVDDIKVGAIVKGTIKKLTDTGLFVSLSGNIDGVVWPNHYADIALKHPAKRFKVGASIKCRVLVVDLQRKRVSLTAKKTLLDSDLPIVSSLEDAQIGLVTNAVIFKITDKQLFVEFYNNVKAIVPMREVSEVPVQLSDAFSVGKIVKVRIIDVAADQNRIIASIRKSTAAQSFNPDTSSVEIGNIVQGKVSEVQKDNVMLSLQPTNVRALLSLNNLANHRDTTAAQLRVSLASGDVLDDLVVVTRNVEKHFVIVATKPKGKASLKGTLSMDTVALGQIVSGRVTRKTRVGTLLKLPSHIGGLLHPTDASDDYETGIPFPAVDAVLKAAVIGIDTGRKQLILSTRHSKMHPDDETPVDLHVGATVRGFIKSVAEHGLFVSIARDIDARVQIRELFDDYVKEWQERFTTDQVVKGRILSVDTATKKVEMTFRTTDSSRKSNITLGDLQKGQKITGSVKKVEDYGLFINIDNSRLSGLCHKSQLSDNKDADVSVALGGFREGDRVKAVVLDIVNKRLSLSLKPSHFTAEDFASDEEDSDGEDDELGAVDDDGSGEEGHVDRASDVEEDPVAADDSDDDDDAMDVSVDPTIDQYKATPSQPSTSKAQKPLTLSTGFDWFAQPKQVLESDAESDISYDDSEDEEQPSKKRRKKRKEVEVDLTAEMHTRAPESTADFDRLLLGSPNSSYLWIQYMAFLIQLADIDKAREIARKALSTISFREEQEKLNVWIALLNLENTYGSEQTLDSTFKEAARANDSKTVHLRLASILDNSDKSQQAEEQYKRTSKKFGQSSKVWTLFAEFYLRRGDIEQARNLLPRSIQSLEKRKHLKTISRFAQLEYKMGEPERGKTLFEGIIDSHPKRWDVWSIYIDMEGRQDNMQSLRALFDRLLTIKMTSHKAKSFFKKWLELERRLGDEEGANVVKQRAVEWTQRANS
ncbi:nucleic acid-binding protein [Hymenopellis radicata]|nr:nucleic acid-binding protein [Hymenopellis radicata]